MQNEWISVKDRLPEKDNKYLCVIDAIGTHCITTCWFSKNLFKVDKYDFANRKGIRGFYNYSSEWGYYQNTSVTHWMPLPELPKGE